MNEFNFLQMTQLFGFYVSSCSGCQMNLLLGMQYLITSWKPEKVLRCPRTGRQDFCALYNTFPMQTNTVQSK